MATQESQGDESQDQSQVERRSKKVVKLKSKKPAAKANRNGLPRPSSKP